MESNKKIQIDTIDCVEYNDLKKEIWIRGHFPDWLCGYLTGVESTIKSLHESSLGNVIQYITVQKSELSYDQDVLTVYKFKNKKEYESIKETIQFGFEYYRNEKSYSPKLIWKKWSK